MPTPNVQQLLNNITLDQSLNTGSLIMTLFGDAVVPRGGCIASSSLQSVMSQFNIDSGAVRTALSRLTSDGNLERERLGRKSFYTLAASQTHAFGNAELQIYPSGEEQKDASQCSLIAIEPGNNIAFDSATPAPLLLNNQLALYFHPAHSSQSIPTNQHCIISGSCQTLPLWLLNSVLPASLIQRYEALIENFATLEHASAVSEIEAVAYRCLLIHEWRRLRLKTPAIPYQLLEPEHILRSTHDQVASWYKVLLNKSDSWWDTTAESRDELLGPPQPRFRSRFGLKA